MSTLRHLHEPCCELRTAVYDCPNCGHREHQLIDGAYATFVTCELNCPGGSGCHEDSARPPGTLPSKSTANLAGFYCPDHGWSQPAHLRQARLL